ncbi:hypothetical protein [Rhodococcus ruber]|uniref:hypothetical protein n=1 Tax=Rhodococcus ruber TaxID=1830 RepID=UPI000F52780F|nr:hypothetical protein [Rhodococcus ruber]
MTSQATYSANNFLFTILVAKYGGLEYLGRIAVAVAAIMAILGLARSVFVEPMIVGSQPGQRAGLLIAELVGVTIITGIGVAVSVLIGAREFAITFAFCAAVVLQDYVRQSLFSGRKYVQSWVIDAAWMICTALSIVLANDQTPGTVVACWGVGSAISTVVGVVLLWRGGLLAMPAQVGVALVRTSGQGLSGSSAANTLIYQVTNTVGVTAAFAAISTADAGEFRLVTTILAPMQIVSVVFVNLSLVAFSQTRPSLSSIRTHSIASLACVSVVGGLCLAIMPFVTDLISGPDANISWYAAISLFAQYCLGAVGNIWLSNLKAARAGWRIAAASLMAVPAVVAAIAISLVTSAPEYLYAGLLVSAAIQLGSSMRMSFISARAVTASR